MTYAGGVRISLRPSENAFFDFFIQAADNLVEAADILAELTGSQPDVERVSEALVQLEHANDEVTHEIISKLNSTFVTPFDREDIYGLASALDDVMDHVESAATFMRLSQLSALPVEAHEIIAVIGDASRATAAAMRRLKPRKDLEQFWIEVNRLENVGDRAHRAVLVRLFSGDYDAMSVLKIRKVADDLEAAVDAFEHVANSVETIIVKES